jgi:hypothetical protein
MKLCPSCGSPIIPRELYDPDGTLASDNSFVCTNPRCDARGSVAARRTSEQQGASRRHAEEERL